MIEYSERDVPSCCGVVVGQCTRGRAVYEHLHEQALCWMVDSRWLTHNSVP